MIDINELRQLTRRYVGITAWSPTSPQELIELIDRLEAAESDAAHQKALADSALRVAEGWERKCGELRAALQHEADCVEAAKAGIEALRAKIAEMEKQEPVAWMLNCPTLGGDTGWILSWTQSGAGLCNRLSGEENEKKLYLSPGAQAQSVPNAVAYLDLGVGGYMDIGTDLTDEELAAIPKGRHGLGLIGTYGVDGYLPPHPAPSVPDGVVEALQRLIENGAVLGPASSEDALLVARYRQRLLACAPSVPEGWLRAIDEALVSAHIGVANADDTYEEARAKLERLIGFHVDVATDPAVNGGWKLVPIEPTEEMREVGVFAGGAYYDVVEAVYEAMLAAAPEVKP